MLLKAREGALAARLASLLAFALFLSFAASAQDAGDAGAALDTLLGQGGEGGLSGTVIILFLVVTVLSLVPGLAMMVTCLPFLIIVFSFIRQALGIQQAPPNMMLMALAIFLTFFIMEPTFTQAWANGVSPYIDGAIDEAVAWQQTTDPFRTFMTARVEPGTVSILGDALQRPVTEGQEPAFPLLATAFMLSEIKHAFQIGFVVFLPFLVIDLVVASVLMAVGMMMVPPTVVSLPFKIGFFVLADGWLKITEALVRGYAG